MKLTIKVVLIFAFLVSMFGINAISVPLDYSVVTNKNAKLFGIAFYKVSKSYKCGPDLEIWITAPKKAKRATFEIRSEQNAMIFLGSLNVQKYIAEPIFKKGATYTDGTTDELLINNQKNYSFMADGFRGITLCINSQYLSKATIKFDDMRPNGLVTKAWDLGKINQWVH